MSKFVSEADAQPVSMLKYSLYASFIALLISIVCSISLTFLEEWLGMSVSENASMSAINIASLIAGAYFSIRHFYKKNHRLFLKSEYRRIIAYTAIFTTLIGMFLGFVYLSLSSDVGDVSLYVLTPFIIIFTFIFQYFYVWISYSSMLFSYKRMIDKDTQKT